MVEGEAQATPEYYAKSCETALSSENASLPEGHSDGPYTQRNGPLTRSSVTGARMRANCYDSSVLRSKRSGRIVHLKRDISTRRVMHVTQKIQRGLPSLRHPAVQARIKQLAAACEQRGVKVIASATMTDHIHLGCCPESREAMTNAMRYFFGE